MNILALDLGTRCGYAARFGDRSVSGMRNVGTRSNEGPGQRWMRFRALLNELGSHGDLAAVYFEEIVRVPGNQAATFAMFGGFRAHLEHWCEVRHVPVYGVALSTIKKHWTGNGHAKKVDMERVCRERGLRPTDDNEADAMALLDYAYCDQGRPTATAIELAPAPRIDTFADPFARPAANVELSEGQA